MNLVNFLRQRSRTKRQNRLISKWNSIPVNDDNDPPVSEPPVAENEDPKVAKWSRIQADPLVMSRCSTWQNAFLKEPNEDTEPYPWRMPIPKEELEPASAPLPVGPIVMWQLTVITKYDLMLIEFTSDGASWTIIQRSKHYSVSRMFLREKPQSVRFMIIVTDPCNVSTREVIKVSREVTEATPLMCAAQAPLEMVLSKPLKPTPQSAKKPLIDKAVGKKP